MIRNGVIVYAHSSGRLYFVCLGSSSFFLWYRPHAQKIRPHTMTPTISAVTEDHVHSTRIFSACLVTPVGQPKRSFFSTSLDEQAESVRAAKPTSALRRMTRVHRLRCTGYRLSPSPAEPVSRLIQRPIGAYWTGQIAPPKGCRVVAARPRP